MSVGVVALLAVSIGTGYMFLESGRMSATSGSSSPFMVNFTEAAQLLQDGGGWARYGYVHEFNFTVAVTNLSWVTFFFRWDDEAGSPLTDPEVSLTFEAPNGTIIFRGPVAEGQDYEWNTSLNEIPEDTKVLAPSEAEAILQAAPGLNETLGTGVWNWTLDVGSVPYARNQVRSGVLMEDRVQVGSIEVSAISTTP